MAIVVNKIKTTNDVNGNPRRGWHVIDTNGMVYSPPNDWWIEEGYSGNESLWAGLKSLVDEGRMKTIYDVHNSGEYEVPVREYKRLKKLYKNL